MSAPCFWHPISGYLSFFRLQMNRKKFSKVTLFCFVFRYPEIPVPKCGLWTSRGSVTWELLPKAILQPLPDLLNRKLQGRDPTTWGVESPPGDCDPFKLRTAGLKQAHCSVSWTEQVSTNDDRVAHSTCTEN